MIAGSLARRYARALFDVGADKGTFERLGDEIDALAKSYEASRDLVEALTNPIFPRSQRQAVLEAVLEKAAVSPTVRHFVLLLLEAERIPYLPAIARELRTLVDQKAGRVHAEVTSATELEPGHVQKIQSALERLSGKSVVLETHQDPELLGGVVAKMGDIVYDGSVRTQLELMRERFLQE
jgi:F-type H+-transporting ATPase subunit delta